MKVVKNKMNVFQNNFYFQIEAMIHLIHQSNHLYQFLAFISYIIYEHVK